MRLNIFPLHHGEQGRDLCPLSVGLQLQKVALVLSELVRRRVEASVLCELEGWRRTVGESGSQLC